LFHAAEIKPRKVKVGEKISLKAMKVNKNCRLQANPKNLFCYQSLKTIYEKFLATN